MKLFWVALTGGSLALNIIQSATFPIPNSEVEFAQLMILLNPGLIIIFDMWLVDVVRGNL